MRSLSEQIADKCVHYNGIANSPTCKAGVRYKDVFPVNGPGPCHKRDGIPPCDKRRFPTPEEVQEIVAKKEARIEQSGKAFRAVAEDAKQHGFKKGNGGSGEIKCPCCADGKLSYSVATANGHTWGSCSSAGCVAWMQ